LFILLNAGQQKVSPRHLLEIMGRQLRSLFESWGVPMLTERERKRSGRRQIRPISELLEENEEIAQGKRSWRADKAMIEGQTVYRYEFLVGGLVAYLDRNPHMRTQALVNASLENAAELTLPGTGAGLESRITEIGEDTLRDDLRWLFVDVNEAMKAAYALDPAWTFAIMQSDTFVFPLLAALGRARGMHPRAHTDERKARLLHLLQEDNPDPLVLSDKDDPSSLRAITDEITSNIGRRRRVIVYQAFNYFFERGPARRGYPLDWDLARNF